MSKKIRYGSACIAMLITGFAQASNLSEVYQMAAQHDATFQAAQAEYAAAKVGIPIARAALLPSIALTANTTLNKPKQVPYRYNSNEYEFQLTQPIFNLGAFGLYSQAQIQVAQSAIKFAQAQQQLITDVATAYFNILEAQEQLKYAQTYESQLKQQMNQTEQQYKVGLKALTDFQSTTASYDSAVADTIGAQNNLYNAFEKLAVLTGQPVPVVAALSSTAPLNSPNPADEDQWVSTALKGNLGYQNSQVQQKISQQGVYLAKVGNGSVPGYTPVLNLNGTKTGNRTHATGESVGGQTNTAGLALTDTLFNGGSTYYTVKQSRDTADSDTFLVEQAKREAIQNTRQYYSEVMSDISQVKALSQAMISGQSSLDATAAAYKVGTRTIVDLLTQQSNLFNTQQQYAKARYQYILDTLSLKQFAGILSEQDIETINQWLEKENPTLKQGQLPKK